MPVDKKERVYIGFTNKTKKYGQYIVTEDLGSQMYVVAFCNGYTKKCHYKEVLSGGIKNPTYPAIYNVACLGEGRFTAKDRYKGCEYNSPAYEVWLGILKRCYNTKAKSYTGYGGKGCSVSGDWLNFQSFAEWYYSQSQDSKDFKWAVDKDLKVRGNKLYSEDTCDLIPYAVNSLFTGATKVTGVTFNTERQLWVAQIQKGSLGSTGRKKQDYLGAYDTKEEAIDVYVAAKLEHTYNVANKYKVHLPKEIYNNLTEKYFVLSLIKDNRG